MFLGEHEHSLDEGTGDPPGEVRDQLTDGGFVTKGRGGCLSVFTPEEFENVASQVRELSKRDQGPQCGAPFFSGVGRHQPRPAGPVAIPANLRAYAGLSRDVVVTGVFSRIEIWDRERWLEHDRVGDLALTDSDDLPEFGI